ncbi:MAG: reprolysin-like metallopeptidase [Ferruginibacter sp.]
MRTSLLICVAFACFLSSLNLHAQQSLWSKAGNSAYNNYTSSVKDSAPGKFLLSKIDLVQLKTILQSAPLEHTDGKFTKGIPFTIQLPDETMLSASVVESPIWDAVYAKQFAHVRTYLLSDPITKSLLGRITLTAEGISGIIFSGKGDVYINPLKNNDPGTHILYFTRDEKTVEFQCGANSSGTDIISALNKPLNVTAGDCKRRTYRLAVATTAEYTAWAGSQANALTYITISINNVIAIYSRDLNITFTIVAPNSILFTNANTDPYPGGDVYLDDAATNANQTAMDNIIGTGAYDVGMVFNKGWNRGYVPVPFGFVCNAANKGKGAAGVATGQGLNPTAGPQGLAFDFTVAHEMGHLFGATHSYASNVGTCTGFATAAAAFEPGSGSTMMGYAGYPTCNTYTNYGESYFHAGSLAQIQSYISGPGNCAASVVTGNNPPVVTVAAASYTIPVSTPFTLSATGTDADGNSLIYTWEQMDAGFLTPSPPAATNTAGPNFRSYAPTPTGNTRTFPGIYDIVAGVSPAYEVLPSVTRTTHFRVTARDGSALGGCTGDANVVVNFNSGAGPFRVTSQPTSVTWAINNPQTITWNVAGTNSAPVNCAVVDILFSTDGGITYPYTLVSNTANDGSEIITVPNLSTQAGRIKVQAVNNIFFNINAANITIVSTCAANGTTITPADSIAVASGSASLSLSLSPQYGTVLTPSGTITTANPSTTLTMYNTSVSSCATYGFSGSYKYNIHSFTVTAPGNYTFTPSTYGLVYNLYRGSFDPAFPCNNFIASNCVTGLTPTTINPSVTASLLPGKYVLTAGTFSPAFPVLPHTYSVAVTGGSIYTNPPNPGVSFSYLYVVVDKATNLVKSIASTADLSNSATYPGGKVYTIYGLSYSNASPSLNNFIGGNFNTLTNALLYNASYCGNLSKNFATRTILTIYTFTGSGNWNVAANWSNNVIPSSPLPQYSAIIINPAGNGECILNVPVIISQGDQLTVQTGKKFRILGNLTIQY